MTKSPGALEATASAMAAATATAAAGSPGGNVVMDSAASAEATPTEEGSSSVVGGGVGLKIEKGPSSETLRLEELKAELRDVAASKKKVSGNSRLTADYCCRNTYLSC